MNLVDSFYPQEHKRITENVHSMVNIRKHGSNLNCNNSIKLPGLIATHEVFFRLVSQKNKKVSKTSVGKARLE